MKFYLPLPLNKQPTSILPLQIIRVVWIGTLSTLCRRLPMQTTQESSLKCRNSCGGVCSFASGCVSTACLLLQSHEKPAQVYCQQRQQRDLAHGFLGPQFSVAQPADFWSYKIVHITSWCANFRPSHRKKEHFVEMHFGKCLLSLILFQKSPNAFRLMTDFCVKNTAYFQHHEDSV